MQGDASGNEMKKIQVLYLSQTADSDPDRVENFPIDFNRGGFFDGLAHNAVFLG